MNTAKLNKDMHTLTHTPVARMLMCYNDKEGQRQVHLIRMKSSNTTALVMRTLTWAAHNGIEVTFRPA